MVGHDPVLRTLLERLSEMTLDWDHGLSGEIDASTALRAELGFSSMDLVMLVVDLQGVSGRHDLPWEHLFAPGGRYVEDVRVGEVADFLNAHLRKPATPGEGP